MPRGFISDILQEVMDEVHTARIKFPSFHTAHEGYAILKEEVDELWDEIKSKQGIRSPEKLRKEAIQVAAMAVRFVADICDTNKAQL